MSRLSDNGDAAPIDCALLAELAGIDPTVERRLLGIFHRTSAADIAAFEEGFASHDLVAMARAAHRI